MAPIHARVRCRYYHRYDHRKGPDTLFASAAPPALKDRPHSHPVCAWAGYNIVNFDLPYLLNRANALKIRSFPYLGRIRGMQTKIKDKMFQSKQTGTRESKEINMEGRVQFDVSTPHPAPHSAP